MNRIKSFLFLSFFSTVCLSSCKNEQKEKAAEAEPVKPNIIFILTDDLGYGDIGIFFQNQRKEKGDRSEPWLETPYLDAMAEEGAQLTQHYTAAPVCAPSRASILLGVNQGHSNVRDNQFDKALEDNYTMANVLKQAGYRTVAIGKWGLQGKGDGPDWPSHPLKRGFDAYYGYIRHRDGHEHYPKEGTYRGPKEVYENYKEVSESLDKCYTGDLFTARAKKYITEHRENHKNKPFFMYLSYDTPHAVLELPTQAYPEGRGLNGGLQWQGKPGEMINTASGEVDSYVYPEYENATWDDDKNPDTPEVPWPDTYKRYATVNRRIDDQVGDLIQLLKDLEIDQNTLVIFTSDNGPSKESYLSKDEYVEYSPEFFNNFGYFDGIKRDTYEGGLRTSTIAFWPGTIPAGSVVNSPSISYDWMPTFAAAAGTTAPVRTDGISLLPSLTGKGKQEESRIYVEYFHPGTTPSYAEFGENHQNTRRKQMQMIRIGDMAGVRYNITSAADDFNIYNVVDDPAQQNDLAGQHTDLQDLMKARVIQMRHTDASAPRTYDNALVPAAPGKSLVNGLMAKSFRNDLPWIPSAPENPVAVARIDNPGEAQFEGNLVCLEGYIKIPEDGKYRFSVNTDKKCFMRLHDISVIDGDFNKDRDREYEVSLSKGYHPIKLYVMGDQPVTGKNLQLMWKYADREGSAVPPSAFYHYPQ
ncbi:sulfatase-like hydrolase/transferase [Sinomicrobium weinanense]|uniref:Sulfatase-like hydrolase/transferase n=1 Tax=Sinomicrobium weinanense TaxID=2842200 RepID=A0A926Q4R9_9FLAO|nr:sulfatase-like hydrolase/transferase [Sinomicrobium weinanense]MBC9797185.1 sulfatase-like hydrolase/transferase [Sinomicrobium weinanense]MBU3125839.1 sulfatase-like hydrolase/transferase [Sinomicrobium weinanense]